MPDWKIIAVIAVLIVFVLALLVILWWYPEVYVPSCVGIEMSAHNSTPICFVAR